MAFNITDFNNKWANFKEELKDYFNKRAVDKNGDTMNGSLVLAKDPEESMEAATKNYVDIFTNFVPGDFRTVDFGSVRVSKQGYSWIYNFKDNNLLIPDGGVVTDFDEQAFPYRPLTNGKVNSIVTISQATSIFTPYWYDGAFGTFRAQSWGSQYNATVSIQITMMFDAKTETIVWEEHEVPIFTTDPSSIFGASQTITIPETPVVLNASPRIKVKTVLHSVSAKVGGVELSSLTCFYRGGIDNKICETSKIYG